MTTYFYQLEVGDIFFASDPREVYMKIDDQDLAKYVNRRITAVDLRTGQTIYIDRQCNVTKIKGGIAIVFEPDEPNGDPSVSLVLS